MSFKEKNPGASVDVFAICYNEAAILPRFITHYKREFGANIKFFDNMSTDCSSDIILRSGCGHELYNSGNQIRDDIYLGIKNRCWKESKSDWVIVVDCDEFLEVDFDCASYSIINTQGYDMLGWPKEDYCRPYSVLKERLGVKNHMMCKHVMFRPCAIKEINYHAGCHKCEPVGTISGSKEMAKLLHWKYLSEDYVYNKHKSYEARLSDFNKKYDFGGHYLGTTRESVAKTFEELIKNAKSVD